MYFKKNERSLSGQVSWKEPKTMNVVEHDKSLHSQMENLQDQIDFSYQLMRPRVMYGEWWIREVWGISDQAYNSRDMS